MPQNKSDFQPYEAVLDEIESWYRPRGYYLRHDERTLGATLALLRLLERIIPNENLAEAILALKQIPGRYVILNSEHTSKLIEIAAHRLEERSERLERRTEGNSGAGCCYRD